MTAVTFEKFTKLSQDQIFEVATNYESFQNLLSEFYPSVRVISKRPTTTLVEVHLILSGKEFVVMQKHVIEKPSLHEIFFVGGDAKGTHITEKYEQSADGTKITLTVDFKYKGSMRLSGFFGKGDVEKEFSKIMDKLIKNAEN